MSCSSELGIVFDTMVRCCCRGVCVRITCCMCVPRLMLFVYCSSPPFTHSKVRTWLPSLRAIDAREAVCESVGYVAGVVSPDVVEPVLPLLLQFLTSTMRSASKDIAKHIISKSLALIIEAVASACGRSFMM